MLFSEAMEHRFACRSYTDRPVSGEDLEKILGYGRLAPTSFGWEGWAFHVVRGGKREKLREAAFGQEAVSQAPVSVVLCARTASFYEPDGKEIRSRAKRTWDEKAAIEDFRGYWQFLKDNGRLDSWSRSQCYIAAGTMTAGAKTLGIDSLIIEGFEERKVLSLLGLDGKKWQAALILLFGYAAVPESPKIRLPLSDLVTWHD